jgi:2,6-dihydroxypseudooxynicotine hydrolase
MSNWAPRFTAQGVDYNDLQRTTARVDTWDDWCREWCATGDRHAGLAAQAEAAGRTLSAGEAAISAALCYHFGKFMFQDHHDEYMAAGRKCIATFAQGLKLLDPTGERVEIPFAGATMVGTLRRPAGADRPPLVFLLPGLDSVKEEFFYWETAFLRRGIATCSLDGPGQGECGYQLPIRPDYEAALTCALDALARRSDLDLRRVGLAGVSLGGYYALRAAAYEPRVTALVSNCSPWNLAECWDHLPFLSRAAFQYHSGAKDLAEAFVNAGTLTLEGSAHRIKQPVLIIHGQLDRLMPWEQARKIAAGIAGRNAELALFSDGNHVCNNIPYVCRPLTADWLREKLG